MSRSTIDTLLSDEHHAEFLRRAARGQIADIHTWLKGLRYEMSRSAVGRKIASLRPVLSPEAVAREHAISVGYLDGRPGRPISVRTALARLRAAVPFIFDRELRAKVEDHIRLIQFVAAERKKGN